jgi:AsmA family protein
MPERHAASARPRRALWRLAAFTFVLLMAGFIAAEASGWPFLRDPLQRRAASAAAVPVRFEGDFSLRLLPSPRVAVQRLHIGAPEGLEVPHLLQADSVVVEGQWRDLWQGARGGAWRLRSVRAAALDAHLVRDAQGRASWQLGQRDAKNPVTTKPPPQVDQLIVAQGDVRWRDALQRADLALRVQTHHSDNGKGSSAGWRGTLAGRWRELTMDLALQADALLPLLERADAPPVGLRVEGDAGAARVKFDGTVAALLDARRLDGRIELSGTSLASAGAPLGVTLPSTPPFRLEGQLKQSEQRWQLLGAQATVGRSRFGGDFDFDAGAQPPRLRAQVAGPRLFLADLGPSIGVAGKQAKEATGDAKPASAARVLPQRRFDLPTLRAMQADVTLRFDELSLGDALASLRDVSTRLRLEGGVLHIEGLQALVAGGKFAADSTLDSNAEPARWQASVQMSNVEVSRWLRITEPGRQPPLSGALQANVQVAGRGESTAALLSTLDGRVSARMRDGTLSHLVTEGAGLDLAQALGVVLRGDRSLPLRCAAFDLAVKDGRATVQRGVIDNADSTIRLGGRVNLGDESLELVARSQPKDFSLLSLRTPITVTGTFGQPRLGLRTSRLAGRVLGGLLLGAVVAPVAALLPLMDAGDREGADPCTAPSR